MNWQTESHAGRRFILAHYGEKLAREMFGVTPIESKEIAKERAPSVPKVELNQDAVLALETLGVQRTEAKRQIKEALGISPNATTQELIVMCLNGK